MLCGGSIEFGEVKICQKHGASYSSTRYVGLECNSLSEADIYSTKTFAGTEEGDLKAVQWVASFLRSYSPGNFVADHVGKPKTFDELGPNCIFIFRRPPGSHSSDCSTVFTGEWHQLWRFEHSKGCFRSSEPDIMIKNHTDNQGMMKSWYLKLCNGARLNIEGILLGMTAGNRIAERRNSTKPGQNWERIQDLLSWEEYLGVSGADSVQDDGYMIHKMFLAQASPEARRIYEPVGRINGWVNVAEECPY